MKTSLAFAALMFLVGCGPEPTQEDITFPSTRDRDELSAIGDDTVIEPANPFTIDYLTETEDPDAYQQWENDQAEYAREQVEWERDDLRRSVRNLQYGDWEDALPRVGRELRDMDNALWDLEMADPNNPAVQDLRYEVDRMQRDMRRLDNENWRDVVPDLDRSSRNIDYGTDDLDIYDSFDENC